MTVIIVVTVVIITVIRSMIVVDVWLSNGRWCGRLVGGVSLIAKDLGGDERSVSYRIEAGSARSTA